MRGFKSIGFSLFILLVLNGHHPSYASSEPRPLSPRALEIAQQLKTNIKWCGTKIRGLFQYINPREQGLHFFYEKGIKKIPRLGQELIRMGELFLSPLPVSLVKLPSDPVFLKLWKDPQYEPSPDEWAILDRYKLREAYSRKKEFMNKRPWWVKVQRGFVAARRIALSASIIFAINHGIQAGVPTDRDTYLNDPAYVLGPTQIQIINESVPFPHSAIRMGDKVYSYGYTHLKVSPVSQYLMNKEEFARFYVEDVAKADPGFSARMTAVAADQLHKLPRSVQIVTLNLSQTEYAELKRDLELSTGNRYHNVTFVHDCTTMAMKKIHEATGIFSCRLFDASPSQTFFYFSALETLGSSRVENVFQVAIDSPTSKATHTIRNFAINVMESKFFIDLLIYDQPQRLYIDIFKSPEELEFREPEVQKEIDSWKLDIQQQISEDSQWRVFDRLVRGRDRYTTEERADIWRQIQDYASTRKMEWEAERNSWEADFKTIVLNDFRIQVVDEKLADYQKLLLGP